MARFGSGHRNSTLDRGRLGRGISQRSGHAVVFDDGPTRVLDESALPGVKYFSGTATYSHLFEVPAADLKAGSEIQLDLGVVREIAEVWLNGVPLGVRWCEPYQFDVTQAVQAGENRLEVKVTNLWVNRLIGDKQSGETPVAVGVEGEEARYRPDALLRISGLLGPVALKRVS